MRFAIVHNDYGNFSGEEAVVRDHINLLSSNGCEVVSFRRSSRELHGLIGAAKVFFRHLESGHSKVFCSFPRSGTTGYCSYSQSLSIN